MKSRFSIVFLLSAILFAGNLQAQPYQFIREINGRTTPESFVGFSEPTGIDIDSASGNIYIASNNTNQIYVFNSDYQYLRSLPVIENQKDQYLNGPAAIAYSPFGIYVVDQFTQYVRRINKKGKVDFVFGGDGFINGLFKSPLGIAVSKNGSIYVSDYSQNNVQIFDSTGKFIIRFGIATNNINALMNGPRGLAVDKDGNILVVDSRNLKVKKYSSDGTYISSSDTIGYVSKRLRFTPSDISLDKSGNMYVGFIDTAMVVKLSPTGKVIGSWAREGIKNDQFSRVYGLAVDNNNSIHLTDDGAFKVMKFSNAGTFIKKVGESSDSDPDFFMLTDATADKNGNVFSVDQYNGYGRVIRFDNTGKYVKQWPVYGGDDGAAEPANITVSDDGNLLVLDKDFNWIYKFDINGKILDTIQPFDSLIFKKSFDVAIDKSGSIYVPDTINRVVYKYSSKGVTSFFGKKLLRVPLGIDADAFGNIYVADSSLHAVFKFTSSGKLIRKFGTKGSGKGQFMFPTDVATDAAGFVYVTDPGNKRIQKFDSTGKFILEWKGATQTIEEILVPFRIDVSGDRLYITDLGKERIVVLEKLIPQTLFIIGKEKFPRNYISQYVITPQVPGLYYKWSYSGSSLDLYQQDSTKPNINGIAGKNTTNGNLACNIYTSNGQLYSSISKTLTIADLDEFYSIPESNCPTVFNKCTGEYIDRVEFSKLENSNTGCSEIGYKDYTTYGMKSEVVLGEIYNANFRLNKSGSGNQYVAMWIDFNNDGDFDDQFEYIGGNSSQTQDVALKNIVIPNQVNYTGQARARVRTRTTKTFAANESCMVVNESGETEDYIVVLLAPLALEGAQAITPNNDGLNDFFVIHGINPMIGNTLVITDVVGNLIYEKEDYKNDWPSAEESVRLKKGTYYYHFKSGSSSLKSYFMVNY